MSVSNRDLHSAENYARATGRNSDGSVRSSLGGRPDLSPLHNCYTRSPRRPAASGSQEFSQLSYAHLHVHVHGHAHAHVRFVFMFMFMSCCHVVHMHVHVYVHVACVHICGTNGVLAVAGRLCIEFG
jgi:hypothetical protein